MRICCASLGVSSLPGWKGDSYSRVVAVSREPELGTNMVSQPALRAKCTSCSMAALGRAVRAATSATPALVGQRTRHARFANAALAAQEHGGRDGPLVRVIEL